VAEHKRNVLVKNNLEYAPFVGNTIPSLFRRL
jgi:hypothetical protein